MMENKKVYVVGLQIGGLMEDPELRFKFLRKVPAENEKEAVNIYNTKLKCDYFYGGIVGYIENDEFIISTKYRIEDDGDIPEILLCETIDLLCKMDTKLSIEDKHEIHDCIILELLAQIQLAILNSSMYNDIDKINIMIRTMIPVLNNFDLLKDITDIYLIQSCDSTIKLCLSIYNKTIDIGSLTDNKISYTNLSKILSNNKSLEYLGINKMVGTILASCMLCDTPLTNITTTIYSEYPFTTAYEVQCKAEKYLGIFDTFLHFSMITCNCGCQTKYVFNYAITSIDTKEYIDILNIMKKISL